MALGLSFVSVTAINGTNLTDTITGSDSGDTINVVGGSDLVSGGLGDDVLNGTSAIGQRLFGGDGNDTITGGGARDTLDGGAGNDVFLAKGAEAFEATIFGGAGHDILRNTDGGAALVLKNTPVLLLGVEEIDAAGAAITASSQGTLDFSAILLTNVTVINGSTLTDTITGSAAGDTINVVGGSDLVSGGLGNDVLNGTSAIGQRLFGGDGNDTITGGGARDTLDGGAGNDVFLAKGAEAFEATIFGGAGHDILRNTDGGAALVLKNTPVLLLGVEEIDAAGAAIKASSAGTLDFSATLLTNVTVINGSTLTDTITGSAAGDTILGEGSNDRLFGGLGNDSISGGEGIDSLSGDNGNDRLAGDNSNDTLSGATGNDRLFGGEGNDSLSGGLGRDTLTGDAGNDLLQGDKGIDKLTGGAGADVFLFRAVAESSVTATDEVTDFLVGTDLIDLTAIDAITGGANDAFTWIGSAAFSSVAGELRIEQIGAGADWYLLGDTTGDGVADLRVRLAGLGLTTSFGDADVLN